MDDGTAMGVRRFGRVNWMGLWTLAARETKRFLAVWTQTLLAPMVTSALFLAVFTLAIGPSRGEVMGVSFLQFLAPGILMMTVIQNAFANTSSSLMASKVQGNIVDTLMPPLSPLELVVGYVSATALRALLVALAIWLVMAIFIGAGLAQPLWALVFVVLGAMFLGGLGLLAAIYAGKYDQMAAITNFVITPLSFLSGTFYSTATLPPVARNLTHWNPVFYLIDGVRYGMIGASDANPWTGLAVLSVVSAGVLWFCWFCFHRGYRLKA